MSFNESFIVITIDVTILIALLHQTSLEDFFLSFPYKRDIKIPLVSVIASVADVAFGVISTLVYNLIST